MRWIFLAPFVVLSSFCLSTKIGHAQLGIPYGDAVNLGGGCYQLTNGSNGQRGSVWYFGTVDVSQSWEMTANVFLGSSNGGGDGLVFVLRDPAASTLGGGGNLLGYGGSISYEAIQPSLGVEIDTYSSYSYGDPSFDHIAILSNGVVDHNASESLSAPVSAMADSSNIEIGEEFDLRVTYCASSQQMTVFWDDQERISKIVDLAFIGTNTVKWGFTASSGGVSNVHRVCDAQWIVLEVGAECECLDSNMNEICDDLEGCAYVTACNFDPAAEADNGTCDYSCCPGPGCCSDGMYWDFDLQVCQVIETCEDDLDGDGVVGVNDLMQLLSSFGTSCPLVEPAEWTCGDPVSYHGYDYETVLIGEQCWFAENLRTELYLNGEEIPSGLDRETWCNATYGATTYYAETADSCVSDPSVNFPGVPCENPEGALEFYGRLYNWHAVNDERELCPSGWHVPSSAEWLSLKEYVDASYPYHSGLVLREHGSWRNPVTGLDLFGFKLRPAGYRSYWNGEGPHYRSAGRVGTWFWTTDNGSDEGKAYSFDHRAFNEINSLVLQNLQGSSQNQHQFGFSVRCLKD